MKAGEHVHVGLELYVTAARLLTKITIYVLKFTPGCSCSNLWNEEVYPCISLTPA